MDIVELRPELQLIRLAFGQAYLWRDGSGGDTELTLIDTGIACSGADLAAAITSLGRRPGDLRRVVLTHFHNDHAGSAAEVRRWGGVEILVHRLDAPVVRGERPGPPPVLTEAEVPLHERITTGLPPAPPAEVDGEFTDGDVLDFGGGALVIGTPGHTDGSIAVHLPAAGVLFTGDIAAHAEGRLLLGPFNTDRALAKDSFARLVLVDADVVCFGHGDPLVDRETDAWRALADRDEVPDPLG